MTQKGPPSGSEGNVFVVRNRYGRRLTLRRTACLLRRTRLLAICGRAIRLLSLLGFRTAPQQFNAREIDGQLGIFLSVFSFVDLEPNLTVDADAVADDEIFR